MQEYRIVLKKDSGLRVWERQDSDAGHITIRLGEWGNIPLRPDSIAMI